MASESTIMTPLSNQDKIDFFIIFWNEIVVLPLAYGNNGYRLSTEIFISYQSSEHIVSISVLANLYAPVNSRRKEYADGRRRQLAKSRYQHDAPMDVIGGSCIFMKSLGITFTSAELGVIVSIEECGRAASESRCSITSVQHTHGSCAAVDPRSYSMSVSFCLIRKRSFPSHSILGPSNITMEVCSLVLYPRSLSNEFSNV